MSSLIFRARLAMFKAMIAKYPDALKKARMDKLYPQEAVFVERTMQKLEKYFPNSKDLPRDIADHLEELPIQLQDDVIKIVLTLIATALER